MRKPSETKAQASGNFCTFVLGFKEVYPAMQKWVCGRHGVMDRLRGRLGKTHLLRSFLSSESIPSSQQRGKAVWNEGLR